MKSDVISECGLFPQSDQMEGAGLSLGQLIGDAGVLLWPLTLDDVTDCADVLDFT